MVQGFFFLKLSVGSAGEASSSVAAVIISVRMLMQRNVCELLIGLIKEPILTSSRKVEGAPELVFPLDYSILQSHSEALSKTP